MVVSTAEDACDTAAAGERGGSVAENGAPSSSAPTELDLTNSHLHDLKDTPIAPTLQLVDLTANRLKDIDPRLLQLTGLRTVNLRQNLLTDVSPWAGAACKGALEDLEFRDNQLKEVPELPGFSRLRRLEVSYNEIRSLAPLSSLDASSMQELDAASNKIGEIEAIGHLTGLTTLELGSNRIRKIENLASLTNLQELWLGRNRIAKVEGLETLKLLRRVSIQSNRLESMLGLEQCTSLEELYLSHNGIWRIEGLAPLTRLKMLDVSNNRISKIEGLETLHALEDLWLNDNSVASLDGIAEPLAPVAGSLTTIYLENNPAAKDPQYKAKLRAILPKLQQLDANSI